MFSIAFKALYVLIGCTLAIVITATVQTFYTLNPHIRHIDRSLQLYSATCLAIIATLPIPIIIVSCLVPHAPHDRFGTGRLRTKVITLFIGTLLLSFGAWYRAGTSWHKPIPRTKPLPGFLGKGPFYVVNFTVEILTVYMYAIMRVDRRWHIPNGAKGPGSYSRSHQSEKVDAEMPRVDSEGEDDAKVKIDHQKEVDHLANADHDVEKGRIPSPSRLAGEAESPLPQKF